jgi:hypothetical protein
MTTHVITLAVFAAVVAAAATRNAVGQSDRPGSPSPTSSAPALVCKVAALSPELRRRHFDELEPALLKLRKSTRELADGYEFEFPQDASTYQLLVEWVGQERLCCPFFDIDLYCAPDSGSLWLRLTGRRGVKEFLKAAGTWVEE